MIYRSKAPFRIGLAGGGTDVSPYSEIYGGAILNATISRFAHATLEPLLEPTLIFQSIDQNKVLEFPSGEIIQNRQFLDLQVGVYNRLLKEKWISPAQGFKLTTSLDVPAGSGLGTSSTLMVSMLKVFSEFLNIPFGDYDLAHLAFEIERKDLLLAGGKQDQYAATFGGFNFMEFSAQDQVIVNPLRIKQEYIFELENNLVLYFTATHRNSSEIILEQQKNVHDNISTSIEAMHHLKEQARWMKDSMLKGQLHEIGNILDFGFQQKRKMATNVSNSLIEAIYETATKAGAKGGKISGAGGGGFMFFYCPGNTKYKVIEQLKSFGGYCLTYQFTDYGVQSWKTPKQI